jgi:diaminopimelate epimerase
MKFWKYQGAGNDFVMLDQRLETWVRRSDSELIAGLCHRRFGVGADGLILLQNCPGFDFEMVYFNADGQESTMCGNGGRCIAAFAQDLGLVSGICRFMAIDGPHEARLTPLYGEDGYWVELKMQDVAQVERHGEAYVLNTGSPHYVCFVEDALSVDVFAEGRAIRRSAPWEKEGINVNFVNNSQASGVHARTVRTYERGVEDETYACGTGVTASAVATFLQENRPPGEYEEHFQTKGGKMSVRFRATSDGRFEDVWLCGPAVRVFEGAT